MSGALMSVILHKRAEEQRKEVRTMRTLDFIVDGQGLVKDPECDFTKIVAGTKGYLRAHFTFDGSGWRGCRKVASFWIADKEYATLLDKDNTCYIPPEVLGEKYFRVSVTGGKDDGYMIKTNKVKVKQEVV